MITINQGTQTTVNTQTLGTAEAQVVRLDMGSGTVAAPFTGTLLGGTITLNSAGSALADTEGNPSPSRVGAMLMGWNTTQWERLRVDQGDGGAATGLFNMVPMTYNGTSYNRLRGDLNGLSMFGRHQDEFATTINTGTSVLGTIKPAVAGSQIFITGLFISVATATNVEIASGGTSTRIAGTYFLNQNGGVALTPINPPLRTAAGSALVYKQSADNGISITAVGYVD